MLAVTTCRAGLAEVYAPSKDKIRQKMEEVKSKSSWESWLQDKPCEQEEVTLRFDNSSALMEDLVVSDEMCITSSKSDETIEKKTGDKITNTSSIPKHVK